MSNTVQTFPAAFGEVLSSGDAALKNPEVTRTRACITVDQALEAEERDAVRRSVDDQFPTVAAFLEDMRASREKMLEGASPAVVAWAERLEDYVAGQPDPEQAPAGVQAALQSEIRCAVYSWCTEHGQHDDHQGAPIAVTAPGATVPYVDAWLLSFGPGAELIGFAESDLTPEQARQEAAKLRVFADQLEDLADTLGGGR
ncbi:DUF6907 domain-containing protein [Streptomyces sp. NPDC127105]|uniref:DUF6907 domain-containing protein n=1 Tax=Streptomyces sp. NPDC127105 TaxID=3345359 RepID=UPI003668E32B